MPYPHQIRLKGPWEFLPLAKYGVSCSGPQEAAVPAATAVKVTIPHSWASLLGRGFSGRARYLRKFNRPAELSADEQLWLCAEGLAPSGSVSINNQPLGIVSRYYDRFESDITGRLHNHNLLSVEIEDPPPGITPLEHDASWNDRNAGLWGPVWLEVRHAQAALFNVTSALAYDAGKPVVHMQACLVGRLDGTANTVTLTVARREWARVVLHPGQQELNLQLPWPTWLPEPHSVWGLTFQIEVEHAGESVWQSSHGVAGGAAFVSADALPGGQANDLGALAHEEWLMPERLMRACGLAHWQRIAADHRWKSADPPALDPAMLWVAEMVYPAAWYAHWSEARLRLIQVVPNAWASDLCRRLSAWPCIAAWGLAKRGIPSVPDSREMQPGIQRPRVDREELARVLCGPGQ